MTREEAIAAIDVTDKDRWCDKQGRSLTQCLFVEYYNPTFPPHYTLAEKDVVKDGKLYLSLKQLYLEAEDIGEYHFVKKYMYSWLQWERLLNNAVIRPFINQWRDELEVKLRSIAIRTLCDLSSTSEAKNTAAAKYIADKAYATKATKKDQQEKARELAVAEQISKETKDDMKRIGLVRNNE